MLLLFLQQLLPLALMCVERDLKAVLAAEMTALVRKLGQEKSERQWLVDFVLGPCPIRHPRAKINRSTRKKMQLAMFDGGG